MKKQKMVMTAASALFMLATMVFMIVSVAAAISHTVNIGSSVSFQAVGKVNATVTITDSKSSAITVQKNGASHSTNGTLTITAEDTSSTGDFALGDLELTADSNATGNVTYSYTISITNNYLTTDTATYKYLDVTFTPPTTNSCVSVNYDEDFSWTDGTDTKIVTIDPNTTATIQVVFTTDVSVSNTADMSCSFVLESSSVVIWDGTTSSTPAGEGTAQSPYLISNGAELKWVSDNVSSSSGKYYTQTKDIYLNDETFTFMPDTGLVYVTDGVNTCYLGTGINDTTMGAVYNNATDTTPSSTAPETNTILTNGGVSVNYWTPIGTSYDTTFQGTYDGNSKTVSGIYINNTSNYQGLFGYNKGTIQNVGVVNGYIKGGERWVGGVCGYNYSSSAKITNCYNTGTVSGTGIGVGGVCGDNDSYGTITNCYNTGTVSGTDINVGGVSGRNGSSSSIENCYNTGTVSCSDEYVGGVCGYNSKGTITNCYNTGTVTGSGGYVGGVCGETYGTITNCYNTGMVSGSSKYVGGVCGETYSAGTITNCYNTGTVTSSGGYVGGVCGGNDVTITNCYNTGTVTGTERVGGVCGNNDGTITNCYNTDDVIGTGKNVGGVCGKNSGTITNCYYLSGCATDGSGTVQLGVGVSSQGSAATAEDGTAPLDTKNDILASMEGVWDFTSIWGYVAGVNDGYPILRVFYSGATISNTHS